MRPIETRLAKKKFNFQFAPESVSYELSGFEHNAITPFGMRRNIPVIICSRLLSPNLSAPVIYLGGGKVFFLFIRMYISLIAFA